MNTPQLPQNDPKNQPDLTSRRALLRTFTSQITSQIHEQSDLLCSTLASVLINQTLVRLYVSYIFIETNEDLPSNPQLSFLFHNFTPTAEADPDTPNATNVEEIINLIRTGHPTNKPADDAPRLLPAPFWKLSEVEDRLINLLATQILYLCVEVAHTLEAPTEDPEMPPTTQVERLIRRTVEALTAFLPTDPETQEPGESTASPDTSSETQDDVEESTEEKPQ